MGGGVICYLRAFIDALKTYWKFIDALKTFWKLEKPQSSKSIHRFKAFSYSAWTGSATSILIVGQIDVGKPIIIIMIPATEPL